MHMLDSQDPTLNNAVGQPCAFDDIFRNYYSVLVLFARKLIRDRPAAEDIVTDIFLKLWQKQLRFTSIQSAKAFLYISTRNACINHLTSARYQAGVRNRIRQQAGEGQEDFVLNHIIRSEVVAQVYRQLEGLPPECRKVMRMSFIGGLSNRQIARQLQLSINTVRNQRARGIHLIRKRMRGPHFQSIDCQ